MLLNTKALEWAGIDAESAKKYGYDLVHVDNNCEPDGYICESPVFELAKMIPYSHEDAKRYLLAWQDIVLEKGYTAVSDAGVKLFSPEIIKAYH